MTSIFQDKLLVDDREPWWLFDDGQFRIGFLPPKPDFIIQIIVIITLQILLANVLAVIAYYGIIISIRGHNTNDTTSNNSNKSLLVGLGIIIPTALYMPFFLANTLDIRAAVLRMGLCALPLSVVFRTLQALCGFTPSYHTASLRNFRCHFGFLYHPRVEHDNKTTKRCSIVPADTSYIITTITRYLFWNICMSVIYSCLVSLQSFEPFPTPKQSHEFHIVLWDMNHLMNTFLSAVILSMSLSLSTNGIAPIIAVLANIQIVPIMDHPMFHSESPSDFWGRRWNRMVHTDLKHGVYLPVKAFTSSRQLATLATFTASGLIHEYVWYVLFYCNQYQRREECYNPQYGKNLLFFMWNGLLLLLEYFIGGRKKWNELVNHRMKLPKPFITCMVILMALPVGHFLTGDLVKGGYIPQLKVAFPLVIVEKV